jgi:hypothetical protein
MSYSCRRNLYTLMAFVFTVMGAAGCTGPRVVVLSSKAIEVQARSPDCTLDFFRTRVERPYDELAALHAEGGDTGRDGPADFEKALRAKACALGADAVLVTQDYTGRGGTMNAVAIRYRDAPGASP